MRTWSLERAVVGFLSGAAVAVQGILDAFSPPNFQPAGDSHPIPGCPDAVECRTHGCAGDCSESMEAVDLSAFVCRAPGPFDCLNCSVDDFTWIPCEYDKTAPAASAGSGVSAAGGGSPPSPSVACTDPSPVRERLDHEAIEAAICVVLATHAPNQVDSGYVVCCFNTQYFRTRVFRDWREWREHVAPLIAEALAPQPKCG